MRNRFNTRETLNISVGGPGGAGDVRAINVSKPGDAAAVGATTGLEKIAVVLNGVNADKLSQSAKIAQTACEFV